MIAKAIRRPDKCYTWEIMIKEDHPMSPIYYTFEVKQHIVPDKTIESPTTILEPINADEFLKAIGVMLQEIGYIPQSSVDTELKATKYHLEDMRKLALK